MTLLADLHIHTNYSDSTLSPQEVVEQANAHNLKCVSITDHDTIVGISPTRDAAQKYDLEVIPGVELSSEIHGKDVHILGYLFDYQRQDIIDMLNCMQNFRVKRMGQMIEKLKAFGIDNITLEEVCSLAKTDSVGRPHLATVLKEKKWVPSIKVAFDKYISEGAPAYVPKFKQTPYEAIELIIKAGGVAVLAHPMITGVDELIPSLVKAGLGGIEAYYPNTPSATVEFYKSLADKYGLAVTGGSDAHGNSKENTSIGSIKIPYQCVEDLKKRVSKES